MSRFDGRGDLLKTKLFFALCDRRLALGDCLELRPSAHELREARPWLEPQDGKPDWPAHVADTLVDLGRRLHHAV